MEMIFSAAGADFLARWVHFMAGITWIGLLYYFNFIQTEYFKESGPEAKASAISKLVPNALFYFRWGAMFTFLSGVYMLHVRSAFLSFDIVVGAVLGTLMFLNVWLIIWPNQKIVIASTNQVLGGGEADPAAAGALAKAGLASRTNTLFSLPMLLFMGSSTHLSTGSISSASMVSMATIFAIIAALQINGMIGKQGPLTSVKGVIHCGLALAVVLYLLAALL